MSECVEGGVGGGAKLEDRSVEVECTLDDDGVEIHVLGCRLTY